jgi:hypothetical protein
MQQQQMQLILTLTNFVFFSQVEEFIIKVFVRVVAGREDGTGGGRAGTSFLLPQR